MYLVTQIFLLSISLMFITCTHKESFPGLGTNLAGPVDVVAHGGGAYFIVLNTDTDRTYDMGSLLVIDNNGEKKASVPTPRLGKSLTLAGDDLLATFEAAENTTHTVKLYDVKDPLNITEQASFDLECVPLNAVMNPDYPYFAVNCIGGTLYVGELKTPRTNSTISKVRSYQTTRRAMYIDVERNLLFMLNTDLGRQDSTEVIWEDSVGFSEKGEEIAGPNEIPDELERKKTNRDNKARQERYQFVIYDLKTQADAGFPYYDKTSNPKAYLQELRWLYFNLNNYDGFPDVTRSDLLGDGAKFRYYRTNFWEAKPDIHNKNGFYASHRGNLNYSPHANNILHFEIVGDPLSFNAATGVPPFTSTYLKVTRIFGFNGEVKIWHYPADFEIFSGFGEDILLVNHFKDLVNREANEKIEFGLVARPVNNFDWLQELHDRSPKNSFYQIAINNKGLAISCLFYANAMVMFNLSPIPGNISTRLIQ